MMKVSVKKEGKGIAASKFLQENKELELSRATLLTGNNGTGKTSFLLALAAHFGLSDRYSSLKAGEHKGHSLLLRGGGDPGKIPGHKRMEVFNSIHDFGHIEPDRSFDWILKYQAPSNRAPINAADEMEDIQRVFDQRMSQGETARTRLYQLTQSFIEAHTKGESVLLLLEVGLSAEALLGISRLITSLVRCVINRELPSKILQEYPDLQGKKSDAYVIIATQCPLLRKTALRQKATEIDFGGWHHEDPFGAYDRMMELLDVT